MCKITDQQIVADGAAVAQALKNLAAALEATDPTLAANLIAAANALVAATQNWQTGDTLTDIETAEQAAIAVLNAIPVTSPYAPLVAIAFAALNLLIANSQTQTPASEPAVSVRELLKKEDSLNTDSPWHGKASIEHNPFHSIRVNFENTWNKAAKPLNVAEVHV